MCSLQFFDTDWLGDWKDTRPIKTNIHSQRRRGFLLEQVGEENQQGEPRFSSTVAVKADVCDDIVCL